MQINLSFTLYDTSEIKETVASNHRILRQSKERGMITII